MNQFLVVLELKGKNTESLKGHVIAERITANSAEEAVSKATNNNRLFEEEGFEIIAVQILYT